MNKPILLCFNLEGERLRAIRFLALGMGIGVRPVKGEEYGQRLAGLLGREAPEVEPHIGEGFREEMLVMADFPSPLVNRFLDAFRHTHIPPVKLKALLTETNAAWDALTLHRNLSEEAEQFRRMRAFVHTQKEAEPSASGDGAPAP
ncbi:MAG: DUF3783 domain-containing protein [Christensenellales bacterium]